MLIKRVTNDLFKSRDLFRLPQLLGAWLACAALLLASAAALTPSAALGGTFTWSGLGSSDDWTTDQNWQGGVAPIPGLFDDIVMAGVVRTTPNVDVPYFIEKLTFNSTAFTFTIGGEALTIGSGGISKQSAFDQTINNDISLVADQGWFSRSNTGSLTINGDVDMNGHTLTLDGGENTLTATGGFTDDGALGIRGNVILSGSAANKYTGTTFAGSVVSTATLELSKSVFNGAVPGDLSISGSSEVRLAADHQIAETPGNEVRLSNGTLNLNGFSDDIWDLDLFGNSSITTGAGTLGILGNVVYRGSRQIPISGNLDLKGGTRTFDINHDIGNSEIDLHVGAAISNGGLLKIGTGHMEMTGSSPNTYAGLTTVDQGSLRLSKSTLNQTINGSLVIGNVSDSGRSTFVVLVSDEQIRAAIGNTVTVNRSGLLSLQHHTETIRDLTLRGGRVELGSTSGGGTLVIRGDVTSLGSTSDAGIGEPPGATQLPETSTLDLDGRTVTFDVRSTSSDLSIGDVEIANGGVTKVGPGTLHFSGRVPNSYTGTTTVNEGTLRLAIDPPFNPPFTVINKTILGDLVIGDGVGGPGADVVSLALPLQISDTSNVTINRSGKLELGGTEIIGDLTMTGGLVTGEVSTGKAIIVDGTFTLVPSSDTATISSVLFRNRTLEIPDGAAAVDLEITGHLLSSITKTGSGTFRQSGVFRPGSSVSLTIDVDAGTLELAGSIGSGITGSGVTQSLNVGAAAGTTSALAVYLGNDQVALTATVNSMGILDMDGFSDTFLTLKMDGGTADLDGGSLVLTGANFLFPNAIALELDNGGSISTGAGMLTVADDVRTVSSSSATGLVRGNLHLDSPFPVTFDIENGAAVDDMAIAAVISGGSLTKKGTGQLVFSGPAGNIYTGTTRVDEGTLVLNKSAGGAIPGDLVIGIDRTAEPVAKVMLAASDQMTSASGKTVTVNRTLDLNGFSDTIANLTLNRQGFVTANDGTLTVTENLVMEGGTITTGAGALGILGTVATNSDLFPRIEGNLDLEAGTRTFNVNGRLSITAAISNGGLTKTGLDTLAFFGSSANTYTGTTTVNEGKLDLGKDSIDGAIAGDLVIGDGVGGIRADVVVLRDNEQITSAQGTSVTINSSGDIDFNGFTETIRDLTLNAVRFNAVKQLKILGNVANSESDTTAVLGGDFELSGTSRTFNVADGIVISDMEVDAVVSESSPGLGLIKTGPGQLTISGGRTNTYTGATLVNQGTLVLGKNVRPDGAIHGDLVIGDGIGTSTDDVVRLTMAEQIGQAPGRTVTVNSSGLFDLNGLFETITDLSLSGGTITMGDGMLTVRGSITGSDSSRTARIAGNLNLDGNTTPFNIDDGVAAVDIEVSAVISNGGLHKTAGGVLNLTGSNTYGGGTTVAGGRLLVNNVSGSATGSGSVTVQDSAVLGGGGFVGGLVNVDPGGTVSPGNSNGILTVDSLAMSAGSTFAVEIGGTTHGVDYDVLAVTNAATVDGDIDVSFIDDFLDSITNADTFTVLTAGSAVTGAFDNGANGARVHAADGVGSFQIHYGIDSALNPDEVVLSRFLLPAKTATWNGGDGNWTRANWTFAPSDIGDPDFPNNVDINAFNAVVPPSGIVTVDQDIAVNVLTLPNNGQIRLDNNLSATEFNWDHQTFIFGPGTLTVGGGLISGRFGRELNSTIRNTGLLTWFAGRVGQNSSAGALVNAGGAQWDITLTNDSTFYAPIAITNEPGAIIRRDGSGTAFLNGQLDNAGLVQVDSGTLQLRRGTSTGGFLVRNGGTLQFDLDGSDVHTISGSVSTRFDPNSSDPAPIVSFAAGRTAVTGTYHVGNAVNVGTTIIKGGSSETTLEYNNISEPATTNMLKLERGALGGTGDFEAGSLMWNTGRFDGNGTTTVGGGAISGTLNVHEERKLLATLRNTGEMIWAEGGIGRSFDSPGSFINDFGADFVITYAQPFTITLASPITVTNQPGATILRNSADGSGIVNLNGVVNNSGLIQVDRGALVLDGGTSTGKFVVTNGGTLEFDVDAGRHLITGSVAAELDPVDPNDPNSPGPDPIVSFADGRTVVTGTYHVGDAVNGGTTIIKGGSSDTTLEYNNVNEPATTNVLELERGVLGGTGNFEAGTLNWHTGRFDGSGTTTVGGGEIRSSSNNSERKLLGTLSNTGTLTWLGGHVGRSSDPTGSFINADGADFVITYAEPFTITLASPITVTNQSGATIVRNSEDGSGIVNLNGQVDNAGLIQVDRGTLVLDRGSSTGMFVVNNGGTLEFDVDGAELHQITGSVAVELDPVDPNDPNSPSPTPIVSFADGRTVVTGTYQVGDAVNGGTTIIKGGLDSKLEYNNISEPATTNVLKLERGALGGTGDFEAGSLMWNTGRFDGSGTTTVGGGEIRPSTNINERRLNTTLRNTGLLIWSGGNVLSEGGSFINVSGAEFDITIDGFAHFAANAAIINESGATIRRNGSGDAHLAGTITNTGDVEAVAGTLILGPYTQIDGTTRVLTGATIISNQTMNIHGGRLEGNGDLYANINNIGGVLAPGLSPGRLTINGDYELADPARLEIELLGLTAGVEHDQLIVNGTANLGGTLEVILLPGLDVPKDSVFDVLLADTVVGSFDEVILPLNAAGDPLLSLDFVDVNGMQQLSLTALDDLLVVPEPATLNAALLGAIVLVVCRQFGQRRIKSHLRRGRGTTFGPWWRKSLSVSSKSIEKRTPIGRRSPIATSLGAQTFRTRRPLLECSSIDRLVRLGSNAFRMDALYLAHGECSGEADETDSVFGDRIRSNCRRRPGC